MPAVLFGDSAVENIEKCLGEDWPKFGIAAYLVLGIRRRWDDAVEEVSDLFDRFEREGRNTDCLYPLFDILVSRVQVFEDPESARRKLQVTFGFVWPAPWRKRFEKAPDPAVVQQEQNRQWREDYLAGKLETKPQPIGPRKKR